MEIVDGFCVVTITCVCARTALSWERGLVCAFLKTYTLVSCAGTPEQTGRLRRSRVF
jgi:hypothetical protein